MTVARGAALQLAVLLEPVTGVMTASVPAADGSAASR